MQTHNDWIASQLRTTPPVSSGKSSAEKSATPPLKPQHGSLLTQHTKVGLLILKNVNNLMAYCRFIRNTLEKKTKRDTDETMVDAMVDCNGWCNIWYNGWCHGVMVNACVDTMVGVMIDKMVYYNGSCNGWRNCWCNGWSNGWCNCWCNGWLQWLM